MQDDLTRLVGLEGFEVRGVSRLVVGSTSRSSWSRARVCCPDCGRASLEVKDRPRVRVRDLPVAGRRTELVWRKRRYRLPAMRLHV